MNSAKPSQATAIALAFTASFLWASSFIYIEIGLTDLAPMTFAAMRYVIGAVSLLLYWLYRGGARTLTVSGSDAILVIALGVLLYTAVPAMQFIGLDQTDAITFNFVFQAGIPLVLALSAGVILKETTTWWQWAGVAVIAAGAWVFFPVRPMGADGRGVALASLAALVIGASNLIQRRVLRDGKASALEVTTISMTIGAVILAIIAILVDDMPSLDARLVLLLLVLGVVNTAVAFFIWHRAVQTLRALHIGVIASTQLVMVPVMALGILGDPFGLRQTFGSIVVLAGIGIVHYAMAWARRQEAEPSDAPQ